MDRRASMNLDQTDAPRSSRRTVRWPLTTKLVFSTGGLLLILAMGVAALTFAQVRRTTLHELEQQGSAIAATMSYAIEGLLDRGGIIEVQRLATNSAMLKSVKKVLIVDLDARVLASSDRMELAQRVDFPWLQVFLQGSRWDTIVEQRDEDTLIVVQPLHSGKFEGASKFGVIGAVRIDMDRQGGRAAAYEAALRVLGVSFGGYAVFTALLALVMRMLVVRPLHQLARTTKRFREGQLSIRSRLRSGDELGLVSMAFDDMAQEVETSMAKMAQEVTARTEALQALTSTLDELQASTALRLKLAETIRELSTPVIRVYDRVIVMPLIGEIDTERAQQIEGSLLAGIERHEARHVIMDLTGVPIVDSQVAAWLLRARRAAGLLGAKVAFVGISAKVAQSMVHLDLEFAGVMTHGDLQSGLLHALRSLNLEIKRRGGPAR